jgi:hypothetical protein
MATPVLQIKRGAFSNLPGLRSGEPGFTTDKYDLFVGIDSTTNNNKFFGSHRYWERENGTNSLYFKLVDRDGTNYVAIKAPNILGGNVTYTFPGTQGASSSVLTNDGSGNLTWASGSANPVFTGIATFSDTTDNILGNADSGAVQIDGGLGVNKNVTVGAGLSVVNNFYVGGISTFVGSVTFKGGTINIGDENTDDINIAGEFVSNLVPNADNTYNIGIGTNKRWKNANFSGVGTFATGAVVDAIQIGITAAGEIDTSSGNLTIDSAGGTVTIDDNLTVTGNLYVNGSTTQVNTSTLTVEDRTIELGVVDGNAPSATTTWDLGVLFNYYQTSAKKSAVVWEQGDARFKFASEVSDGGGTDNNSPQITFTSFAPIEISALWVTDCAGTSQVISCTGNERFLQNITVDAGTF